MARENLTATVPLERATQSRGEDADSPLHSGVKRRSFLKGLGVAGAALSASALLAAEAGPEEHSGALTKGDAAILRFLAGSTPNSEESRTAKSPRWLVS